MSPKAQETHFNQFSEDSVPKGWTSNKDGNGLMVKRDKKDWEKEHYTVPMVTMLGEEDSTEIGPADSTNMISVKGMKRRKGK